MCGISGIYGIGESEIQSEWLKAMATKLKHRGPDDEGFVFFKEEDAVCEGGTDTPNEAFSVYLPYRPERESCNIAKAGMAHRRLSILDTSVLAHQPMCDFHRRYWITYNGEIYNYKDIRQELESLGATFFSHSDTEVVLQAYIYWGEKSLLKFEGMWSFAIYDKAKNILFCARDRMGVKPFYFLPSKHYFAFASELKALIDLPFYQKKLNEAAVYDYLVLGKTEGDAEGFFKGVFELMPGHMLTLSLKDGEMKNLRYYQLNYNPRFGSYNDQQAQKYGFEINYKLKNAVEARLHADVIVGACLSGGIDSSSLVCLANAWVNNRNLNVFTSVFPGQKCDESDWAKMVVDQNNHTWHTVETLSGDLLNLYESLIYHQDIPFLNSSTLAQYKVMRLVHQQGIKVTLDGQGADELFSGYNRHMTTFGMQSLFSGHLDAWIKLIYNPNRSQALSWTKTISKNIANQCFKNQYYKALKNKKYDFRALKSEFWYDNASRFKLHESSLNLNQMLWEESTGWQLKYLLRTADRNSMAHSVEARLPFVDDHALVEYIHQIPACYKAHRGQSKYLLRTAMKGIIPEKIRLRQDKKGFETPEKSWLKMSKNEIKPLLFDHLEPFVNLDYLDKNWDIIFEQDLEHNSIGISKFLIFSLWRKLYNI